MLIPVLRSMSFSILITALLALIGAGTGFGQGTKAPPYPAVKQAHCFSAPAECGFPSAGSAGVSKGVSLTPSDSIEVNEPGAVVKDVDVSGTIVIAADDVTVEDTRVTQNSTCGYHNGSCGNYAIGIEPGLTGIKIRNVETRSVPGRTCEQDIRNTGSQVVIDGAYLHACDGNIFTTGPTLLKNSYAITKLEIDDDHIENVYFEGTTFKAIHNTLLNPIEQTAVIFGNAEGGSDTTNCDNRLTVLGNLLAGGGYTLYPCAHTVKPGSSYMNVQGNHFARCTTKEGYKPDGGNHPCVGGFDENGYYPNSGSYGVATDFYAGAGTWRGNVWDNNLAKVSLK
jgi:hypothetical protein